jgi:single-stranded-DNA-specific exonuclease
MNFTSVSGKNWIFKKFNSSDVKKYCEEYTLNEIVAKLLSIRKNDIENIDFFLNPAIKNIMPNPYCLKNMDVAIDRIYHSIIKKEPIGIFGDYDVDGATSTALLLRYFLSINQKTHIYIPDRKKEGYGPTIKGFENLINIGAKLIMTVDCGTMSFEPIKIAQNRNVDVIVLDHHQSDLKLPKACALVNPNRYDDTSQLNYLCATGVCFMFLVALNKKLRETDWFINNNKKEPNILNSLDLVSLATVCDVVPLIGLNRAFVYQGLKVIKKRLNLGLKILYDLCEIKSEPNTYHLGYVLGPRINAGGRVGKSSHGAELLSSNDPQKVYKIATDLNKSNKERQSIEFILTKQVYSLIDNFKNDPVLVLSGEGWHEGIIGIVASRIKERYNKPTIIISLNENLGKGSARSVNGFDIGKQIIKCTQLRILEGGGGHKMAGGFIIKKNNINLFRNFLIDNYEKSQLSSSSIRNLYLDSLIAPSAINDEFYHEVCRLAPFGAGNIEPKFAIENLKVINSNFVADKHIKSVLHGEDGSIIKSIAFNAKNGPLEPFLNQKNKKKFNIAGKITLNSWRGKQNIEFIIEDLSIN